MESGKSLFGGGSELNKTGNLFQTAWAGSTADSGVDGSGGTRGSLFGGLKPVASFGTFGSNASKSTFPTTSSSSVFGGGGGDSFLKSSQFGGDKSATAAKEIGSRVAGRGRPSSSRASAFAALGAKTPKRGTYINFSSCYLTLTDWCSCGVTDKC